MDFVSFTEPGKFEVIMTRFATATFARGYYRQLVREIGLTGDEIVMDFGSGSGMTSRYIAEGLSKGDGHLTCVDISRIWIEVAKKRTKSFSNVDYRVGEISSLDIDDKSYDMVVVSFVLHDVEEQKRSVIVNELVRRLKPGGRIVIKEPTKRDHGMEPSDIRMLMSGAGLKEEESKSLKSRFDAIYRK